MSIRRWKENQTLFAITLRLQCVLIRLSVIKQNQRTSLYLLHGFCWWVNLQLLSTWFNKSIPTAWFSHRCVSLLGCSVQDVLYFYLTLQNMNTILILARSSSISSSPLSSLRLYRYKQSLKMCCSHCQQQDILLPSSFHSFFPPPHPPSSLATSASLHLLSILFPALSSTLSRVFPLFLPPSQLHNTVCNMI